MNRVVCLAVIVLMTLPVLAGPSSDDGERPANRATQKLEIRVRVSGFFERVQGKLGFTADCEITRVSGRPYCATHRSYDCEVLSEGAYDSTGKWIWCDPVEFEGRPYCASHRRWDCPILSRAQGDSGSALGQPCQFGTKDGRPYCVVHRSFTCVQPVSDARTRVTAPRTSPARTRKPMPTRGSHPDPSIPRYE